MSQILMVFIGFKILQHLAETWLSRLNRSYYLDSAKQTEVCSALDIGSEDFSKTLEYTSDKYNFAVITGWFNFIVFIAFLAAGGIGWIETLAKQISNSVSGGNIVTGIAFFGVFGLVSMVYGIPFSWYQTFVIEEKHGFNRQTKKQFIGDRFKGVLLASLLGGPLIGGLLYVMEVTGATWWIWAWFVMSGFSLFASWIYPTLLAPLFNKFSKIEDGELKTGIFDFSKKIGFRTAGIYIMDASTRSSHGNAYFTGMFGAKRIVLFDTLVKSLKNQEIVAVLAHELGHFKLNHVRWGLLRGILMTGAMFYLMSLCLPLEVFYKAFALEGVSSYGALLVFTMWFGLLDFIIQPIGSFVSRKNEFEADSFAKEHLGKESDLVNALVKLRESNHSMPISHPWFSMMYHSHPPLMERFAALAAIK